MLSIHKYKRVIILFILISFLTVVFLGSMAMMRGPDGDMQGECPFSVLGALLCAENTLPAVFHHISAYQSFFNISINFGIIFFIIFLSFVLNSYFINLFLHKPPLVFSRIFYNFSADTSYKRKIMHWLSLLENSPSLS